MFALASLAVLSLALVARADVVVSTPDSITECQPVTFQVSGSTPGPYFAFIVDATNPCGDALAEIDNISGTSFSWTANVTAGTSVMVAIESEDGTEGWNAGVTVGAGDGSCLSGASSSSTTTSSSSTPPAVYAAQTTTTHTTSHTTSSQNVVPVNAATDVPSTSGANRAAVGVSSIVALVGAVAAAALAL